MIPTLCRALALVLAGAFAATPAAIAANYTLTVEPTFPADQIESVHGPLVDYLNRSTGYQFTVRAAPNFNQHWRALRAGDAAEFVFEEGHFFDYRSQRSGAVALARTVEDSAFIVAVADPAVAAAGANGVVGRTIASLSAPNLGEVLVFDAYRNPLAQPELRAVSTKWSDGPDLVFAGEVEGTLLPSYMAGEHPALIEVWRSRAVPGRVLSAGPAIPQDVRAAVAEAMRKLQDDPDAYSALIELRTAGFIAADPQDYLGLERLLANTFGYLPPGRTGRPAAAPPAAASAAPPASPGETNGS